MLKFVIVVVVLSVFCRWAVGKWPWDFFGAASSRDKALARARTLLNVAPGAGREEIIAAHRRLTALVHPDRGGTNSDMQAANAARDLLLDELPPSRDGGAP